MLDALVAKLRDLLQGETLRAITWGAIVVVWLVTHIGSTLGILHTAPPSFELITDAVYAAIIFLNEVIRQYVSSPKTAAGWLAYTAWLEKQRPGVTVTDAPADPAPPASPTPDPTVPDPAAPPAPAATDPLTVDAAEGVGSAGADPDVLPGDAGIVGNSAIRCSARNKGFRCTRVLNHAGRHVDVHESSWPG